mmetsp:Transcript_65009/g.163841  ORF Transcript_65009/g.163841 Transcript_65009/m.163841 type:complete len:259 (+) Transcript_65009:420-1196(+)
MGSLYLQGSLLPSCVDAHVPFRASSFGDRSCAGAWRPGRTSLLGLAVQEDIADVHVQETSLDAFSRKDDGLGADAQPHQLTPSRRRKPHFTVEAGLYLLGCQYRLTDQLIPALRYSTPYGKNKLVVCAEFLDPNFMVPQRILPWCTVGLEPESFAPRCRRDDAVVVGGCLQTPRALDCDRDGHRSRPPRAHGLVVDAVLQLQELVSTLPAERFPRGYPPRRRQLSQVDLVAPLAHNILGIVAGAQEELQLGAVQLIAH